MSFHTWDWDLIKVFSCDHSDFCLSAVVRGGRSIVRGLLSSRWRWRLTGVGSGRRGRPDDPQMSSRDPIRFSITVSSHHSERRETVEGRRGGGEQMKGCGGRMESQHNTEACEMQWSRGASLRLFLRILRLFGCESP